MCTMPDKRWKANTSKEYQQTERFRRLDRLIDGEIKSGRKHPRLAGNEHRLGHVRGLIETFIHTIEELVRYRVGLAVIEREDGNCLLQFEVHDLKPSGW